MASDVTITFEPELTATGGQSPALDELVELFSQPIPTLVPGPKLTSVYYDPVAPATPADLTGRRRPRSSTRVTCPLPDAVGALPLGARAA